jgi:lipopolysaccharide heptosyltransferase II/tetraacyldisaccharide 4'-kinase
MAVSADQLNPPSLFFLMSLDEPRYRRFFRNLYPEDQFASGLLGRLRRAGTALYEVGARGRRGLYQKGWRKTQHLPAPVVSVGNLTVGGTGKTPVTAYLARLFQAQRLRVAILSRGYGGRRREVTCLSDGDRLYHRPPEVGEEAYWLAESLPGIPVYTGPGRYEAGMAAWQDHRPDLFLLDDGFQHFQLARDLDIVLLDADRPFGNGRLLPAGPLREPLSTLAEADIVILTRYDPRRHQKHILDLKRVFPYLEVFTAALEPTMARRFPGGEEHPLENLCQLPILAFAGLARPRVFEDTLVNLGTDLRGFRAFPDHYPYSPEDLADLVREARERHAETLITTSKDWARLGEKWPGDLPLVVLEVAARVEPEQVFCNCLMAALGWRMRSRGVQETGSQVHRLDTFFHRAGLPSAITVRGIEVRDYEPDAPQPLPPQVRRAYRKLSVRGKAPPDFSQVRRILLRAPNWVGDAIMSLPVLAGLSDLFPSARVTVLAAPRVAPLFSDQPGVSAILPYPAGPEKWRFLLGLKNTFDLALALPNSLESALGLWLTRTPHRLGYAADGRAYLLTLALKEKKRLQGLHQVFYYLGLLEAFGPVKKFYPPRLHLSQAELDDAGILFQEHGLNPGAPLIGLAPGAAYGPAKRWPAECFAAVGDLLQEELQAGLALLGGPADREAASAVQRLGRGRYLNLAGQTTLRQALVTLSQLNVLITNDSGLMHAAAALGVPVVALFGSTDPAATGPFSSRATVIHHPLPCSPCLKRTCSRDYACLTEITVAEVANAARNWVK